MGGPFSQKTCREHLVQAISVTTTLVTISRRVCRRKLALRDRQAARGGGRREGGRGGRIASHGIGVACTQ